MDTASSEPSSLTVAVSENGEQFALEGTLDIRTIAEARESLKPRKLRALALGDLSGLDTPGALFLCGLREKGVKLTGIRPEHKAVLDLIGGLELKPLLKPK